MQISVILLSIASFLEWARTATSSCLTSDQVCIDNSGVCTKPLYTYLENMDNTERRDIWNVLSYGHYCGASTKCVADNLEKGGEGVGPTPPEPCNAIDDACMKHDACLDGLKSENRNNPKIPYPMRCGCELGIVSGMYDAKMARANGTDLGQLCDGEYYDLPIIEALQMDEEDFLAIPFCFLIFAECMNEVDLLAEYQNELAYCNSLAQGLNSVLGN